MCKYCEDEKKIIERIEDTFYSNTGKKNNHFQKVTLYEEGITDILKLLNFVEKQQKELEQKESILDKVTDKLKEVKFEIESGYSQINGDYFMAQDRLDLINEMLNIIEGGKK